MKQKLLALCLAAVAACSVLAAPVITTVAQTMDARVGTNPTLKPLATDDSGSVAETVIVSADGELGDDLIDEEEQYQEELAAQLKAEQDKALLKLADALAAYSQSEYSEKNYALITAAYESAKDAIYAETDATKLNGYVTQFITAADEVKTTKEETELPPIPVDPPDTPDEPDTPDDPDDPDEPDTPDVPADPPVELPTENPEDEAPSVGETNKPTEGPENGCGSTVAAATVALTLCGALVALKKKKE